MKNILFFIFLANCAMLFAQSPMTDINKQWMIEDINKGNFGKAAQEISHIENWTFDATDEKSFVNINNALSFTEYADSIGVAKSIIDSLMLYVGNECYLLYNYYFSNGDYATAIPYCELEVEIRKNVLGENHPQYAAFLSNLAGTRCLYRQPDEAPREVS